ncbi:MAG TPA: UDP-N-acetylmuramoyl-tripeptide--D-alanyl-D-alanine ligase [Gammaproteobacteria bacterium]|nr:UDP-N-acetylmuramoyl-tripeptide--D-alanyl-D-alanine ligase [Gammaproteobacteria bacterium]
MIRGRLSRIAPRLHARQMGPDAEFEGLTSDSRRVSAGQLFVALRGTRFDGHEYVRSAARDGASAALVERYIDRGPGQLVVADSRRGLGDLARLWRERFEIPLVGVTGSNGKTTVKEMLAAILRQRGPVLATEGNRNNDIGLPLTLCRLEARHAAAVLEMGANHAGEIAYLAGVARPGVGVVTNAGAAHLEGFGSREGVARAKGELFQALPAEGCAVINADDRYAGLWRELASGCRRLSFGLDRAADVRAVSIEAAPAAGGVPGTRFELCLAGARVTVALPLPGAHNVMNALAAAAAAVAVGVDAERIRRGLQQVRPAAGRLQVVAGRRGARLLDDTYNANPNSLRAGLEVLAGLGGRRWLVLGDMGELGAGAAALHREAGAQARAAGVERLYALGGLARETCAGFGGGARHFDTLESLVEAVAEELAPEVSVLVKGSRAMHMERVVQALRAGPPGGTD